MILSVNEKGELLNESIFSPLKDDCRYTSVKDRLFAFNPSPRLARGVSLYGGFHKNDRNK